MRMEHPKKKNTSTSKVHRISNLIRYAIAAATTVEILLIIWALVAPRISFAASNTCVQGMRGSVENNIDNRKARIRQFVLFNYRHIADDLVAQNGIYLDSLCRLLGQNCNKNLLAHQVSDQFLRTRSIAQFAIAIGDLYTRQANTVDTSKYACAR